MIEAAVIVRTIEASVTIGGCCNECEGIQLVVLIRAESFVPLEVHLMERPSRCNIKRRGWQGNVRTMCQ